MHCRSSQQADTWNRDRDSVLVHFLSRLVWGAESPTALVKLPMLKKKQEKKSGIMLQKKTEEKTVLICLLAIVLQTSDYNFTEQPYVLFYR